jgi:NADPH:quinone reductase-like Zn-dependent oxidoreductase
VGPNIDGHGWRVGDALCALVPGGGFGELVAVNSAHVFAAPPGLTPAQCAGLPEVAATVWSNVFMDADLRPGQSILLHGGGSGIGSFATQLAKAIGARVVVTASASKLEPCRALGADVALDYRDSDLHESLEAAAGPRGFDVVLDILGGPSIDANVDLLARGGRLVVISFQQGAKATLDLRALLAKRARLSGSMLRNRPVAERTEIIRAVADDLLPHVVAGRVAPIIDSVFPLEEADAALRRVERSEHFGKVIIEVGNKVSEARGEEG